MRKPHQRAIRQLRASWRDTILLFREFRQPLLLFVIAIAGVGWFYFYLSQAAGEPVNSLVEAIYLVLGMTFLQSGGQFPLALSLQIFYFVMPVLGVSILAQGLADFGVLLFNRRARGKEWEMAVASTFNNHVVLVGLGHLGYRVVQELDHLNQDVVVIELKPKPDLHRAIQDAGIPVIEDDATREDILISAGVKRARSIMLCTQNDSLNLQVALKARKLNPKIEVIIRIFDDDFAQSLHQQFGFRALSATGMAAPIFAASAARVDVTPPISIQGKPHILAQLKISSHSHLKKQTVLEIEEGFRVSIVMLTHHEQTSYHPGAQQTIESDDVIAIFGNPEQVNLLVHENL